MPERRDWREDLYKPSAGGTRDMHPENRMHKNVLYSSVEEMEAAKRREENDRKLRVLASMANQYADNSP